MARKYTKVEQLTENVRACHEQGETYDAQFAWNFMKSFARDAQTGELIVLP